ncbi:DUF58 domain-containing protein [Paraflavitalea sp. CAU 1676]|uniref:DUF58 domain-containing protein n=1 Tax=Paraflavitalea sp. CAU 1676 TaxID=3032598 RepID=UPI0023DB88D0|nr:DUF58 domain-containing protein [Paraflavitalea sp. CAU 1676]MDF2187948.1 DUF58 domain-containing protein [Paraflavitalea sp. CAU 1676]
MPIADPNILISLRNLSLAAKTTIDGFMTGANKSAIKGSGMEFSQYRSYMPGDDLRWMDWKMYARSDRYYIRESESETNISVRLLVDASASMDHRDGQYTKMEYARYLAACLAYLANMQGDAVGLYVMREDGIFSLAARQGFQNLNRLYYQLEQAGPAGKFTQPVHYKDIYAGGRTRELLVFITDLYQENNEIYTLLDLLGALRHEIIVLHLMGRNEMDLTYSGYTTLEDLETGNTVQVDTAAIKKEYQEKLNTHLENIKKELLGRNIDYRLLITDEPVDQALRNYLKARNR